MDNEIVEETEFCGMTGEELEAELNHARKGKEPENRGEWHKLRQTLIGVTKRLVIGRKAPRIIAYRFEDGSTAWRYASEAKLRHDPPPVGAV